MNMTKYCINISHLTFETQQDWLTSILVADIFAGCILQSNFNSVRSGLIDYSVSFIPQWTDGDIPVDNRSCLID